MNNKQKIIYLLIGLKGSGKSYIGSILEQEFCIKFLRVEDWAKKVKQNRDITDSSYLHEVFTAIENGVKNSLEKYDKIVFESTGVTEYFDKMLNNLKESYKVITIGIQTENELCLKRVKTRDQSIHINISDDNVNMVNSEVLKRNFISEYYIDNNCKTKIEIVNELSEIMKNID